ncbi:MAG TPA: 4-oxalocrotonate tautomerase [Acidimicrobiales bacterium]|nr:4-oxalocrotonate tautomerase [Acidimicrobiales bacterium]
MPLINVNMATGRTPEQKRKLMAAITAAVQESIGAPLGSIRVWISEFEPEEFMAAGELLSERQAGN